MKRINVLLAIALLVTASCSSDEEIITPVAEPIADFSYEVSVLNQITTPNGTFNVAPAEARFSNNSKNSMTYDWSFGDGNESNEHSPEHTFEEAGTYKINLFATGEGGVERHEETITIVDFSDLFVGDYTYESDAVSSTGETTKIFGVVSVDEFGDGFKLNFDSGEEILYTDRWQRNDIDLLELNVETLTTAEYQVSGYRSKTSDFHGTFYPSDNSFFVSLSVKDFYNNESFTIFFSASKK